MPLPIHWVQLNRLTCIGVQQARVVAIAYWEPEAPGMEYDPDVPGDPGEPIVMVSAYYLTRIDQPHGEMVRQGP